MEFVCDFFINNKRYLIYNVDKIEGKDTYVGRSDYDDRTLYIEKESKEQMLLTLKHE